MLSTMVKIVAFLAAAWCWTSEALFYDGACPGVQGELQCPEDSNIFVMAMKHGVKRDATCELKHQSAQVSDNDCIDPLMVAWVKQYCNTKQSCKLPRPNPRMFQCDYSPDTFYQVSYQCLTMPNVRTAVVCEGESQTIQCGEGAKIQLMYTNFGRTDANTCTSTPSRHIFCTSDAARPAVKELCNGKKECTLTATTEHFGKPVNCDDNPLYLAVDFLCLSTDIYPS